MKILIIKTSALGDILHTLPAVRFIQELVPDAEIDWVVEKACAPLIENDYKLHVIDTKKWRRNLWSSFQEVRQAISSLRQKTYDVVFDFQGNTKSGILLSLSKAKVKVGFGRKTVPEKPNLLFTSLQVDPDPGCNIRQDYLALVEGWSQKKARLEQFGKQKSFSNILVCPGSKWKNKQLPLNTLAEFLQEIQKESQFWILHGNDEEKTQAEFLKGKLKNATLVERLSLPELKQFMKQMDTVIAMDSLPLHLAGEVGIPTFSLFGPSLAEKYRPLGEIHRSVQGTCPYGHTFAKRCPILRTCPTGACMTNLDPHDLAKSFNYFKKN